MKIVFAERRLRIDKLAIMLLSAVLKRAGHEVILLQDEIENIEVYMSENKVDYVMYSVMSGEHQWFIDKNRELKKKFDFVSVMGGPHFTFFPEQGENDSDVDFVFIGPAENFIVDLVEGKYTDKIIRGDLPACLDNYISPDRDILYRYDYFAFSGIRRFITTRVCKNACAYCFNHTYKKMYKDQKERFYLRLDPSIIVDEIVGVNNKYGLTMSYFNDDDLACDTEWLKEFCLDYKKRVGVPFSGGVRADSVDEDTLKMMAEAGCSYLSIALESAVLSTQRLLRRSSATNERVEKAVSAAMKNGIKVRIMNMIGLPVDNPLDDALTTLEFNKKLAPTDAWASIFQPLPKTDMWKYCLENGFINENTECMNFYDDSVLNIQDRDKINRLHKWWFFSLYYNIDPGVLNVLLELPLTNEQKLQLQNVRWGIAKDLLY